MDSVRPLPDLRVEIDYFRKLFCHVQPMIGIHREGKPSLLPMEGTPAPKSDHMIIKARVDMSGYQIGQSKLNLSVLLFHEPCWFPGKSGMRYPVQALHAIDVLDGDVLVALEGYIRAPRRAVIAGAEIEASLDLLGDGSLIAPVDGEVSASSWVEDDRAIADHAWQHIEKTSISPTMKPEEIS